MMSCISAMPNKKLNKIVEKIERGTIFYRLFSPPQQIIDVGSMWRLEVPSYILGEGESLVAKGYRHCPSHWEWVLILRYYKGQPWLSAIQKEFSEGLGGIREVAPIDMHPPAISIVREPNQWLSKGGVPEQISVYFAIDNRKFHWKPSVGEITAQLRLAFNLYGWDGPEGLKSEIFVRI